MSTGNYRSLVLKFAVVSGIAISLMQCSKPQVVKPPLGSHPFPCNPNSSRTVHIKTQLDAPGVSLEFVVLCKNDSVIWDTDPGTHADHFTITFKSGTPFKDSSNNDKPTFSDTDSTGKAGDAGLSDTQTYAYYKYSIVVKNDADHTDHPYDPGVIIVQ